MSARAARLSWLLVVASLFALASPRLAFAQERRIETAAKDALRRARTDYQAGDFDTGLARLLKATKACGTIRCSTPTRAALLRDTGVMRLRRGEAKKAAALFNEAVRTDAKIDLTPPYDAADVRAAWDAATGGEKVDVGSAEATPQPTGDFVHTPVGEQAVNTPIPLYVEYSGSEHVASVVVKYRSLDGEEWKHVSLDRVNGGWGGMIPCSDVKLGTLRYYVQGFDAAGSPNALSGDPKRPFHTAVRSSISTVPPSLPGQSPPSACEEGHVDAHVNLASSCIDDSQCSGGTCVDGHCAEPTTTSESSRAFARVWIGVSGSLDLVLLSSADDVCALTPGATPFNSAGYTCTNPQTGTDYPSRTNAAENGTLTPGKAGHVNGGVSEGDLRLLASFDYAFTANLLVGARAGAVVHTGAGPAAFTGGAMKAPFHFEARGTWVFGADALARGGFAPLVLVDAGVARFDVGRNVTVTPTGIGALEKEAWRTGGPWFVGAGVGLRYAFSQRIAFTATAKVAHAFGGSALTAFAPEGGLAYGF